MPTPDVIRVTEETLQEASAMMLQLASAHFADWLTEPEIEELLARLRMVQRGEVVVEHLRTALYRRLDCIKEGEG